MNIFIAGLSYNLSDADLEELFAEYGEVTSAKIIMDRETGRSKGFGFVEMDDEAGKKAIEALNDVEVDGKTIAVSVARPREEGAARRSYGGGGGGGYRGGNREGGYSGGNSRGGGYGSNNRGGGYGGGRDRY